MKRLKDNSIFELLVMNDFIFDYDVLDVFLKLYGFDGLEKLANWLKSKGRDDMAHFINDYIDNLVK